MRRRLCLERDELRLLHRLLLRRALGHIALVHGVPADGHGDAVHGRDALHAEPGDSPPDGILPLPLQPKLLDGAVKATLVDLRVKRLRQLAHFAELPGNQRPPEGGEELVRSGLAGVERQRGKLLRHGEQIV